MKKLSTLFMALIAVVAMQANVVDTLTAVSTGIKSAEKAAYDAFNYTGVSGAEYEVYAYGKQDFIQIRISDNKSGVVSTKSAGYVKSVKIVMNAGKTTKAVDVDIFASNEAYTAAADLYGDKANKVGSIQTQKVGEYIFEKNYTYVGIKSQTGSKYIDSIYVEWGDEKIPGGDEEEWVPDTISVTEAKALIDAKDNHSHYVVGVVAQVPFEPIKTTYSYSFFMIDANNPTDSLEAFTIYQADGSKFASLEAMTEVIELNDTVMIFANGLALYNDKVYETTQGKYIKTLGKSQVIDITEEYPYSVGATYVGRTEKGAIKYDVLLTKTEDVEEGLHLIITTNDSLAIAGSHALYNDSYIDGETATCNGGTAKLTYVSNDGNYNKYNLNATFGFGEKNYKINREYAIAGWTAEFDPIDFANDRPFIPAEGDTITGAKALSFAKSLGGEGIESDIKVYVHGWVSSNPKTQKPGQLQFYMDDTEEGSSNSPVQAYYCYEQGLDSIVKGDEVLLYGKIQLFKEKAEVSNGQIYRLNDGPRHARNIECVEEPDGAISVARAMEIGNALIAPVEQTVETPDVYTVVGYIAKVSYQTKNDTATWFMTDEKGATFGDLQAYKCYIPAMILAGDKVMITGKIAKYQKSADAANIEFAKGTGAFVCEEGTDLEVIKEQAIKLNVNKVIINGQFFILKDGKMFDGRGNVVVR